MDTLRKLLTSEDEKVRFSAAKALLEWEAKVGNLRPSEDEEAPIWTAIRERADED